MDGSTLVGLIALGQIVGGPPAPVHSYDRAPAYLASPYPVWHQGYYLPSYHNPTLTPPPSDLPQFPANREWSPSNTLWYSARSVPWYYGYWYYPRYVPVQPPAHAGPIVVPAPPVGPIGQGH